MNTCRASARSQLHLAEWLCTLISCSIAQTLCPASHIRINILVIVDFDIGEAYAVLRVSIGFMASTPLRLPDGSGANNGIESNSKNTSSSWSGFEEALPEQKKGKRLQSVSETKDGDAPCS